MRPPTRLAAVLACSVLPLALLPAAGDAPPAAPAPEAALPGIVFVGAPVFDPKTDGGQGVYQGSYHWRDSYIYPRSATYHVDERTVGPPRFGRNLYALVPARPGGKLTRLTHLTSGAVFRPEPSFDGKKVLFAMRRDGEDWFHLYEVNVDGTGLRPLTDGPFNDFGGAYLPDGRFVFCSDRTGYLEEYHEERTETLFTMNGDGTGLRQLTFLPGTYFEPSVLQDGRILFSFWDPFHIDVPPFDKHETYLATVRPDGTEERHLFGAGQYRFFNRERHSGVGLTQAREMPDGRILCQSEFGPTLIDLRAGPSARDALAPVFPGTTSVQLGGTTHRVHLSPLGTRSTPYPLADGRFLYSKTPPGARDSGVWVCDPDTRREQLVIDLPDHAEFDAVPVLVERPRPAVLPSKAGAAPPASGGRKAPDAPDQGAHAPRSPQAPMTCFLVVAGRVADNPQRQQALQRARFFRVIEAEYTGVTTSSHTNLETRVLGVVPILPDGSAYFEAPADTPVFLDPLDAAGNRVLMEWGYPNTSVKEGTHYPATQMAYMSGRAGETRACYGCHAPQNTAVPNASLLALKLPPARVTRESTDLQYRRNEPEAYRRQARIGDVAKARPWLASEDPALRARACELLMYVEDGAEPDVPAVVKLLKDEAVDVRRAAALALTRLATADDAPALRAALADADWQVRFAAAAALEAVGEVDGLDKEPLASSATPVPFESLARRKPTPENLARVREELKKDVPDTRAVRAAGKLRDAGAVPLLVPWLRKHVWEYHAAGAAVALGRIGTPEAVAALWDAVRSEVPLRQVHISRYLQHGPRPEEYALLKGLLLANAKADLADAHLLIALVPNTFTEKPRFEDRMRAETQRVLMPRLMLDRSGLRQRAVALLWASLCGDRRKGDPLYAQLLKGINLERPFSEHGRPFNVVKEIGPEEALWLLVSLLEPDADLGTVMRRDELEERVVPLLRSANHRERIDAAVLLGRTGFGMRAEDALAAEVAKPYAFPEIWSIGKGMPDDNVRDKAYMVLALARHAADVGRLRPFADPRLMTRDVRYGLAHGLASRGNPDAVSLLKEMASRDPITLVRQQARYALADIQDACRLAGRPVPEVTLPEEQPLEALYPPRGLTWPEPHPPELPNVVAGGASGAAAPEKLLADCLAPGHFRDLNNAQATGAGKLMTGKVEVMREAFAALAKVPGEAGRKPLLAALDLPYPYAHYLAAEALAQRGEREAVPALVGKLDAYAKAADTVGFWWCCEALGRLGAKEAVPALARHAVATNPPGTFGPEGMPTGYVAAAALAWIAADPKQPDVARCLAGDNAWLRAGALRGLAEARAPGVRELLRVAAGEEYPALVRQEASVQLSSIQER
jgi:HEAT repeat protein